MSYDANCFYCTRDQRLQDLMIEIGDLSIAKVYLFKEQTYRGRCVVALNRHEREIFDLKPEEVASYFQDVARVANAIDQAFKPSKINYGLFGDTVPHIHCHVVPKYDGGHRWGTMFEMNPGQVYLSDAEYQEIIAQIKKFL